MRNQLYNKGTAASGRDLLVRSAVFSISLFALLGLLCFAPFADEMAHPVAAQDNSSGDLAALAHKILTDPDPFLLDLQYALEHEDDGLADYFATRDCITAGKDCSGGISPYGFYLYGKTMRTSGGRTCVTTVWPEYADKDPVKDFSDRDLVRMWRHWQKRAARGDAEATQKVGIVKRVGLYVIMTHHGYGPTAHLRDVPRPKDLDNENMRLLENRTWLVEFSVPKTPLYDELAQLGIEAPDPSAKDVKLRGYYIKGDGIGDQLPLLVYYTGLGGTTLGSGILRVPYWVASGFDVLIVDKRGHGWSTGFSEVIGGDIYAMLDQLAKGVKSYGPDDDLKRKPLRRKNLLGAPLAADAISYTAKTKPVILLGRSLGSLVVMRAMAMNYGNRQIEGTSDGGIEYASSNGKPLGYNIKGVVELTGFSGSHKYVTEPMLALASGFWIDDLKTNSMAPSAVYGSMDKWPAYFALKPSLDYAPPQGVIDSYNEKLRGLKKVVMVEGGHNAWTSELQQAYCIQEMINWSTDVITAKEVPSGNDDHTDLKKELKKMPDSADDNRLTEAEKWLKRMMKKFKNRQ